MSNKLCRKRKTCKFFFLILQIQQFKLLNFFEVFGSQKKSGKIPKNNFTSLKLSFQGLN